MPVRNDFAPGEFCWIDFMAHDLEAAAAFYGQVFGWTHMLMPGPPGAPPYGFLMNGENRVGGIGQMSAEMKTQGVPPMWNSYVATADCEATEAKARELGATVTVPTLEVPGHGKLAFFLDPAGASIATWQNLASEGHGVQTQDAGSLSWNELMTRNSDQAASFYGSLFGWEFASMPMGDIDYTLIKNADKDAGGIMPMAGPQFEGVPPHWLVYFAVEDCDATAAKVTASGGQVRVPPTEIPIGKFSVLADPQGGTFCVVTVTKQDC